LKPDIGDAFYVAGLSLVTLGVAFIFWPAALITCGAILLITTAAALKTKGK
jgi:hypothetical protein